MGFKSVLRKVRRLGLDGLYARVDRIHRDFVHLERGRPHVKDPILHLQVGDLQSRAVKALPDRRPLREAEFKVFSQFGDDGVLQYIISRIAPIDLFVEFGVETYEEANTRFLLHHDNWRGVIFDGREDLEECLLRQGLPLLHDLTVRSAFITAENIESLFQAAEVPEEFGLLSIDIDGNDYWVWKALGSYRPQVVVVEYNAVFGSHRAVTIPYEPAFRRQDAHSSWLYFGASLPAFIHLAETKGYAFVGCTSAGNNAYFVRKDLAAPFHQPTLKEGFVDSRFRESRGPGGGMSSLLGPARRAAIAHLPVVDIITGETSPLGEAP